jgi:hypothetical protein
LVPLKLIAGNAFALVADAIESSADILAFRPEPVWFGGGRRTPGAAPPSDPPGGRR